MRKAFLSLLFLTCLTPGFALGADRVFATGNSARVLPPPYVPLPLGLKIQTLKVCAGELPSGWIKVDEEWNPAMCGNPGVAILNVWTLERYETRIVGSEMQACVGPVPNGWTLVSTYRDTVRCGSIDPAYQNVMTIRRVH